MEPAYWAIPLYRRIDAPTSAVPLLLPRPRWSGLARHALRQVGTDQERLHALWLSLKPEMSIMSMAGDFCKRIFQDMGRACLYQLAPSPHLQLSPPSCLPLPLRMCSRSEGQSQIEKGLLMVMMGLSKHLPELGLLFTRSVVSLDQVRRRLLAANHVREFPPSDMLQQRNACPSEHHDSCMGIEGAFGQYYVPAHLWRGRRGLAADVHARAIHSPWF